MASVVIDSTDGVLELLIDQHAQIRRLFGEVAETSGKQRADAFFGLRRLLAVHETAEDLVVHPRARWRLPDGDPVSNPRLQEEQAVKEMLVALEKMPVDSELFEAGFARLREAVGEHADAEEREEFPGLAEALSDGELRRMRTAAHLAEAIGPTRAHPRAVFAVENAVIGGFTAMLDRARDLISHPSGSGGSDDGDRADDDDDDDDDDVERESTDGD